MPKRVTAYFTKRDDKGKVISTEEQELYEGDAREACEKFPQEWSMKPPKASDVAAKPAAAKKSKTKSKPAAAKPAAVEEIRDGGAEKVAKP